MIKRIAWEKVMGLVLCVIVVVGHGGAVQASEPVFSDVRESHWAWQNGTIAWGISKNITNGYPDGTFQPERNVTEPEFLAMLLRAFPEVELPGVDDDPWHATYYALAERYEWPVLYDVDGEVFNRGLVAVLLAATQGERLAQTDAIQFVLDHELARGKTTATIEGYFPEDKLTRAEALSLIKNIADRQLTLHSLAEEVEPGEGVEAGGEGEEEEEEELPSVSGEFEVRGVMIGHTVAEVVAKLGEPNRKDPSMYGFTWYIYNEDYADYAQIGVEGGKVVALFSNVDNWSSQHGMTLGTSEAAFEDAYGERVEVIMKDRVGYVQSNVVFLVDGNYVTVFVDEHDDDRVVGILVVTEAVEMGLKGFYPEASEALELAFERQVFDLANAARVRFGLTPFEWDDAIAATAKKHSVDMAEHGYMAHTNLAGKSPFERMADDGIRYSAAAENVAAGYANAIFVHDGWMNSLGHRNNILSQNTTRLGVGAAFGDSRYTLYYTQKFYTPR